MKIKKLALLFGILILYLVTINFIAAINRSVSIEKENESLNDGTIKLGVSDSVSVKVVRERFYGVYYISNGDNNLYLLNLVKVPIEIKGFSFFWIHLIFMLSWSVMVWFMLDEKVPKENTYFKYEPLA